MKRLAFALLFAGVSLFAANNDDPKKPRCLELLTDGEFVSQSSDSPSDWLQLGVLLGHIEGQSRELHLLALETLVEPIPTAVKLERLLVLHAAIDGLTIQAPSELERRGELLQQVLAGYLADPKAQPHQSEKEIQGDIDRNQASLERTTRPLFEMFARCPYEFRRRILQAAVAKMDRIARQPAGGPRESMMITYQALLAAHMDDSDMFAYYLAFAGIPGRAGTLRDFRYTGGRPLPLEQYEILLIKALSANAYAFGELKVAPPRLVNEVLLTPVVNALAISDAELLPILMDGFLQVLQSMGRPAKIFYRDFPAMELSATNWNSKTKPALQLVFDSH